MSFLASWLEQFNTRYDALRRIAFVLLTLWIHAAALFYLTMMLFTGHTLGAAKANANLAQPKHIVEISFAPRATPPIPQAETQPDLKFDPNAIAQTQAAAPEPPPQPPAPQQKPDEKTAPTSAKEGILDCDSLDRKPERIVLGPSSLNIPPQENATGNVILKMKIHQDGTVLGVKVESSTMSTRVQDMIVKWVATSLFHPGEMGGVKVDCELHFEFTISGSDNPDTAH